MNKFYAVVTPETTGIFTSWSRVCSIVIGTKNAIHKSFSTYDEAKDFVFSNLCEIDIQDFGLNLCPLYLNKKFVRYDKFIEASK